MIACSQAIVVACSQFIQVVFKFLIASFWATTVAAKAVVHFTSTIVKR
jgi:hypothetical protein